MRLLTREDGTALVMALVALAFLAAIGATLLLSSSTDILIAGAFRDRRAAVYAADAAVARAIDELAAYADWNVLLGGAVSPVLADGPPFGTRALADGSTIDFAQIVNMANCEKPTPCTSADLEAVSARRPWGANNPVWQLYAYGPLRSLLAPAAGDQPWYVVLMLGDDPLRNEDAIALRAEAFGRRSAHAAIEVAAARPPAAAVSNGGGSPPAMTILSWREVR